MKYQIILFNLLVEIVSFCLLCLYFRNVSGGDIALFFFWGIFFIIHLVILIGITIKKSKFVHNEFIGLILGVVINISVFIFFNYTFVSNREPMIIRDPNGYPIDTLYYDGENWILSSENREESKKD